MPHVGDNSANLQKEQHSARPSLTSNSFSRGSPTKKLSASHSQQDMSTQSASPNNKVDHNEDKDVNSDNFCSQELSSSDSDSSEFEFGLKSEHPEDNFSQSNVFSQKK